MLLNAALDANGTTTPAFLVGAQNNAVNGTLTVISGSTAATETIIVQQSNDGVAWTAFVSSSGFDGKTGPTVASGLLFGGTALLTGKYIRLVVKGPSTGYVIVNLSINFYRA